MRRLRKAAHEIGVEIKLSQRIVGLSNFNTYKAGACYIPSYRMAVIPTKTVKDHSEYAVFALAHELGHAEIFDAAPTRLEFTQLFNILHRLQEPIPPEVGKPVLADEVEATDRGLRILDELGIKLDGRRVRSWRRQNESAYEEMAGCRIARK